MAEEKKVKDKAEKKPNFIVRMWRKLTKLVKDVSGEMKKVVWTSKGELKKSTKIVLITVVAFAVATACGVLIAKLMNVFLPKGKKINPLIGSAGVSAVPMAARVSQKVGQADNPSNFLLMHAMGPNVAGVIGSAIAAGVLIALV